MLTASGTNCVEMGAYGIAYLEERKSPGPLKRAAAAALVVWLCATRRMWSVLCRASSLSLQGAGIVLLFVCYRAGKWLLLSSYSLCSLRGCFVTVSFREHHFAQVCSAPYQWRTVSKQWTNNSDHFLMVWGCCRFAVSTSARCCCIIIAVLYFVGLIRLFCWWYLLTVVRVFLIKPVSIALVKNSVSFESEVLTVSKFRWPHWMCSRIQVIWSMVEISFYFILGPSLPRNAIFSKLPSTGCACRQSFPNFLLKFCGPLPATNDG